MQLSSKTCPACDTARSTLTVRPEVDGTTASWEALQGAWAGLFAKKIFFPYFRCENCGLLYNKNYFTSDQLDALYGDMAPNMAEAVDPELLQATQEGYFDLIARAVPATPGSYLELGPDIGTFARKCRSAAKFEKFWFVEPNRSVWSQLSQDFASDLVLDHELSLIDRIPDGSLKLVVGIHVFDHLLEPVKVLDMIRPKMAPGGIVLSVTHDEGSLLARVFRARWPAYCLQHPQLYNSQSIRSIFNASNFQTLRVAKTKNTFPLGFLIRQGLWAAARLSIKKIPVLDAIPVKLRLGNIAAVATLKASG